MMQFVPENDPFLKLFPHRFDFLYARHYKPGESPQWHSDDRYPLSDRQIIQGEYLYGVRFGAETRYFMLDIDRGSPYHPKRDRFAVGRMLEALETLGITDYVAITSSYSEGIHLYFPLSEPVPSWQIAEVVAHQLRNKGFLIQDGLLEIFPNTATFDRDDSKFSLYKGHRLPLQAGSYLINDFWELEWTSPEIFVKRWRFCSVRNHINQVTFNLILRQCRNGFRKLGYKASKFLNDLNTEIEPGWTGYGQTNHLLGRITLRCYIFGHCLEGCEPLEGEMLVASIVQVATRLPGYEQYCRHQHEIWSRAEEWARCVESSKYYHFGNSKPSTKGDSLQAEKSSITYNSFRQKMATERLAFAIADLLNQERFPAGILERFNILTQEYGFSGQTLYQPWHLDLWHPEFIGTFLEDGTVDPPPAPPQQIPNSRFAASSEGAQRKAAKSLLDDSDRNPLQGKDLGWFQGWSDDDIGCNPLPAKGYNNWEQFWEERERFSPLPPPDEGGGKGE